MRSFSTGLILCIVISGCGSSDSPTENPTPSSDATPNSAFDGTYDVTADATTQFDIYGDSCGEGGEGTLTISNGQVMGMLTSSFGERFSISGSVQPNGAMSFGVAIGDENAASFEGSIGSDSGNGTWEDIFRCSGTWTIVKNASDEPVEVVPSVSPNPGPTPEPDPAPDPGPAPIPDAAPDPDLTPDTDPATGTVSGFVTDRDTGSTVPEVRVRIGDTETVTSSDGSYTIADVEAGQRTITALVEGYAGHTGTHAVIEGVTTSYDIVLAPSPSDCPPNLPDAVIAYPFSGNADDASGNGNDGTVEGASLADDRFGNAESAYRFDGSDDAIRIGPLGQVPFPLTVSIWFSAASLEYSHIFSNDETNNGRNRYGVGVVLSALPAAGVGTAVVGAHTYQGFSAPQNRTTYLTVAGDLYTTNTWHHLLIAFEANRDRTIYLDGQALDGTYTGSGQQILYSGGDGLIGRIHRNSVPEAQFTGVLDDILVFDEALSGEKVLQIFNLPSECI